MSISSYEDFWKVNAKCMGLGKDIPRVPVSLFLNGDWICEFLKLDCQLWYGNYEFQQSMRDKCSEMTERELGHKIPHDVDFGVVMDASIYGGEVHCSKNATPVLKPVINDAEEIDAFIEKAEKIDFLSAGLIPTYLEWRERIRKDYGVQLQYGDAIKGCATTLGQLCGITNFCEWTLTEPEAIDKLAQCWCDTTIKYVEAIREATGYEPTGKFSIMSDVTSFLPPYVYKDLIMERELAVYERFAGGPKDVRYYHADNHLMHILPYLREIGVREFNIDPYVQAKDILDVVPDAVIYGQIPPTQVLLYGTPQDVRECVRRDIEQAGASRQIIICPAGSVNPGTSFDNLRAMCEAVEEFGYIY